MDFFQAQDTAKKKTRTLLVYFFLALSGVFIAIYFLMWGAGLWIDEKNFKPDLWHPTLALGVVISTSLIVGISILFKIRTLSEGGHVVAESLGGRLLLSNTASLPERKVLNVVEEMAIAANMPVPAVYLLEEPSINAFAAGFNPTDQVVGVTRGCIETLSRDELQGVIAHEFSHLLNGDTKLNMRLMGTVFGIIVLSILGKSVIEIAARTGGGKNSGQIKLFLFVIGLGLLIIGVVGEFFGNMIKAAISRQREFLADASAVQFTRNPQGIAGALKKIGGLSSGSKIRHASAEEASHLFFSNGLHNFWSALFSTHPPLQDRILAIDPQFTGEFPEVHSNPESPTQNEGISAFQSTPPPFPTAKATPQKPSSPASPLIVPPAVNDSWKNWVSEPTQAWGTILALVASNGADKQASNEEWIQPQIPPAVFESFQKIKSKLEMLTFAQHHSIAWASINALRALSQEQYQQFSWSLEQLIAADGEVSLFEYAIQKIVRRHLEPYFHQRPHTSIKHKGWPSIEPEALVLLSAFAYLQDSDLETNRIAFQKSWLGLALKTGNLLPPTGCGLEAIDQALNHLADAEPSWKIKILDACRTIVTHDGVINESESTLLLAVAAILETH